METKASHVKPVKGLLIPFNFFPSASYFIVQGLAVRFEVEPSTLSYRCLAMSVQVRPTSSLGLSPLPNMDEFINITKLPLSAAPYSIASSASTDGLWSLIFIYSGKKIGHLWVIPRAAFIKCLNKWRKLVGPVFGRGCRFVFHAFSILYMPHLFPSFLSFQSYWS